jgi:hypothetical protein
MRASSAVSTLRSRLAVAAVLAALPGTAHASFLSGETLDKAAEVLAWIVLVVAPVIGIAVFWLVHILPEKIAEKKNHPQAKAIQVVCLLSLVFGGMLWPLAWLWAYTKPVLHKLAYGTDQGEHGEAGQAKPPGEDTQVTHGEEDDVKSLRARIAELEAKLARVAAQAEKA